MNLLFFGNRTIALACFLATILSGCGGGSINDSTPNAIQSQPSPYEIVGKEMKGFAVGSTTSSNLVYVLFDPQCPHCANLWQSSLALQNKVKFIWVPLAFLNAKSKAQAAAILGAPNPFMAMAQHEGSLQAGTGGIALPINISNELDTAITKNTELMKTLGTNSVPYIITKHAKTGLVITQTGSLSTTALADFIGIN